MDRESICLKTNESYPIKSKCENFKEEEENSK
jgi:hypothetical protein